jgi:hypothetical protein
MRTLVITALGSGSGGMSELEGRILADNDRTVMAASLGFNNAAADSNLEAKICLRNL